MAATDPCFSHADEHLAWLQSQARLPQGFRVGSTKVSFVSAETGKPAESTLTLISLDQPSPVSAGVFTRNAFPGAPVRIGRERLQAPLWSTIVINNKVSNVCAPEGEARSRALCAAVARQLGVDESAVVPCSTGVIGWRLPAAELINALPTAIASLQSATILPAAQGIVTTDLYPKIRRRDFSGGGSIVGIAKGAGMIEPNLATMLVYLLTDISIPREVLRQLLQESADDSFNCISVDSDESTSDTLLALSSQRVTGVSTETFAEALRGVCQELAEDVVRNGEGVRHVQRVRVCGAPSRELARGVGKAVVNSPLWKTALAGNDPNVGRLVAAVGKYLGRHHPDCPVEKTRIHLGDAEIFSGGQFTLDPVTEAQLKKLLEHTELYPAKPAADGITFVPPLRFPSHPRVVPITIDLGHGDAWVEVVGGDLTHEYITENADYRS
ncbi:MAG: bifunctional ornithine acetyltransferase/N-acetylglutamate synthase [Planctomycetota bacterium]|nr:MAG: bifunctional ornithine acetyltransferase/N-acetylglutamate synthase [Planctomycetota bacterium]